MKAVALTGTPGTGKSTISRVLKERGYNVVRVMDLVRMTGTHSAYSRKDRCHIVDTEEFGTLCEPVWSSGDGLTIVEGHLAHFASCPAAIVLRCHPSKLSARLENRGWKRGKVLENVQSEVLDVILIEATERVKCVHEIDTSDLRPSRAADMVEMVIEGKLRGEPLKSRWRGEIEKWF